jgi:hypothetical protein
MLSRWRRTWLLSDKSAYVIGHIINLTGGAR